MNKKNYPGWYYEHVDLGYNYRLNEIQSALGLAQLKRLEKWIKIREKIFNIYSKELSKLPLILPKKFKNLKSSNHLYVIQTLDKSGKIRDKLQFFEKKRIEANLHYIQYIHNHIIKKLVLKITNFQMLICIIRDVYQFRCLLV